MACKNDRLTKLEAALNRAEAGLSDAEGGVRSTTPCEANSIGWVVIRDGKRVYPNHGSIIGDAIVEVVRTLEPAINAMVLERVQAAHDKARLELQEACREVAEL